MDMMAGRGLFPLLTATSAALLASCGLLRGGAEVHYKVTVEVFENGRVRSGSSVWSWRLSKPDVARAAPYDGKLRGEAVAVDLDDGRTLFAILRGADGETGMAELLPERLFGDIGRSVNGRQTRFNSDRVADLRDIASRTGETAVLDCARHPAWCPMLVTFGDLRDPLSVEPVDPGDLATAFGPGHVLKRISVEITDENPGTGIAKRLPWLSRHPEPRLDRAYRGSASPNLAQRLTHGDFSRGMSDGS
jgi:hypothetical protein